MVCILISGIGLNKSQFRNMKNQIRVSQPKKIYIHIYSTWNANRSCAIKTWKTNSLPKTTVAHGRLYFGVWTPLAVRPRHSLHCLQCWEKLKIYLSGKFAGGPCRQSGSADLLRCMYLIQLRFDSDIVSKLETVAYTYSLIVLAKKASMVL